METIKVVFAILMIQNGSTIEMVPTEGLSDCLKQKRVISRNIEKNKRAYTCNVRRLRLLSTKTWAD